MSLLFALLSGLMYTISGLITRKILKGVSDAWAFSFWFSAIGALVCLPIMILSPKFPTERFPWILLFIAAFLIVVQNFLTFSASKFIPPSVSGTITKLRIVWVYLFSLVVLHEVFYVHKFIGIIFTVLAGSLLTFSKTEIHSKIGVLYAIGATVTFAFVILFYAPLLYAFNAPTLTFFIFLIPACINAVIMPDARHRIPALLSTHTYMVLAAGVAGGLANIGMNSALMTGNATQTLVIVESFLIVTLVGEHIVLKEKKGVVKKIISVLLAVAGALLIKIT